MAITRDDIYDHLYLHLDIDDSDLDKRLIDRWVNEGWAKIARARGAWPNFEAVTELGVLAGATDYPAPLREVTSIEETVTDGVLAMLSVAEAELRYPPPVPSSRPQHWSKWAGSIRIWPVPDGAYTLRVRGYRAPQRPTERATNESIDLPHADAEEVLLNYALYKALLREDEMEQADYVRKEFEVGLKEFAEAETRAPTHTPIVLNSRRSGGSDLPDRLRFADGEWLL